MTLLVSLGPLPLAGLALVIGGHAAFFRRGFLVNTRLWYAALLLALVPAFWAPVFDEASSFHGNRAYAIALGLVSIGGVILSARARGYLVYNVSDTAFGRALDATGVAESAVNIGESLWPVALHLRPRRGSEGAFPATVNRLRETLRQTPHTGALTPAFHLLLAMLALTPLIVTQSR